MNKIACIGAYPHGWNPGMLSVDLAMPYEVDRYNIEQEYEINGKKSYYLEKVEQLYDYALVVYWGDFLHYLGYVNPNWFQRQCDARRFTAEQMWDFWYKIMLLENEDVKSVSLGTTLYGLDISHLNNTRYKHSLTNFFKKSKLIMFRDMVSTALANQLGAKSIFGCDLAFLLDSSNIKPCDNCLVYSFGRIGENEKLEQFTKSFAEFLGLKALDCGWFSGSSLEEKLSYIKGAALVITDIYHLSISAMRENKPIFCVGKGLSDSKTTLSDKKKEILFRQHFGMDYFIYFENLSEELFPKLKEIYLDEDKFKVFNSVLKSQIKYTNEVLWRF